MSPKSKIEALLFISGAPFSLEKIVSLTGIKKQAAEEMLEELKKEYGDGQRGIRIAVVDKKYQMVTAPENAELIQDFLREEVIGELTRPQLETLTVIAYRGPITKIELEQIRGVNCSLILRNLMIRGLIEQRKAEDVEKYLITHDFLKHLGITSTRDLPDYERLSRDKNLADLLERARESHKSINSEP